MKHYAGIGARDTPVHVLALMEKAANYLDLSGYTLRSGGANGADTAFADGAYKKEIHLPWREYNKNPSVLHNPSAQAIELASNFHPNWSACSQGVVKMHGRNMHILLGEDLKTPVEFVICWTKNGKDIGGTGLAIRAAEYLEIPVLNLHDQTTYNELMRTVCE